MFKRILVLLACAALAAPALAGGYGGYRYGTHYHGHGHGGDADELLAGLVIGGLLGYFISEDRHYRRGAYPAYRHRPYYRDDYYDHGYHRSTYREYVPVRRAPRRIIVTDVVREDPEPAGHTCRMTREYTTTVEIDGRQREAYGTRCLTADGSWVLGPPKLAPELD